MPAKAYTISYEYLGTVNGQPVGRVYVLRVADVVPGYPEDVWSYTKDPAKATHWPTYREAEDERLVHTWQRSCVEEV